jgi:hypothetical protein
MKLLSERRVEAMILGLLCTTGVGGCLRAELTPELLDQVERYGDAESVHLKATVEFWQMGDDGAPRSGVGAYEYWEQGIRYRVSVSLPETLELSRVTDLAFDGSRRQMLLADSRILTVSRLDSRQVPVALANPLFLPLSFLAPAPESCGRCELRLADFRAARRDPETGGVAKKGGVAWLQAAARQVSWQGEEIAAIALDGPSGQPWGRVLFSDYRALESWSGRFPMMQRLELFSEEATSPELVVVYRIERLDFNLPLADSIFSIPTDRADKIWNDDDRVFEPLGGAPESRLR